MTPEDDEPRIKLEQSRIDVEERWRKRWVKVLERELDLKEREAAKPTPVWKTTAGVAMIGGLITLVTGLTTNFVQNRNAMVAKHQELQSELIQKAIERAPNHVAAALNLNFLWQAGLLPDYDKIPAFVGKYGILSGEKTPLPSKQTFGPNVSAVPPEDMPQYQLIVPDGVVSKAAQRVLKIAVAEINKNIHENASFQEVQKYWDALHMGADAMQGSLPWSAAFVSWVLSEAGDPGHLRKSAAGMDIWNSAVTKGLTFQMNEKSPLPGDLIFFSRTGNATQERRAGQVVAPSHPGIIYNVSDNEVSVISGNTGNAVRVRNYSILNLKSDPQLIGFVRLPDE